ncbi:MAG TPA: DUF4197 domain-containing protein [Gallionella sp.]|nr:DUF4197 domain-containing protein [Gallionella sp.]
MRHSLIAFALLSGLVLNASAGTFDLSAFKAKLNDLTRPISTNSAAPTGSGLDRFSTSEQIESLRQALTQGAKASVSTLARKDGFLGNPRVRIPLPDNLQKTDRVMRKIGLGKYSDQLITSMNRAAEAAVPEAKNLLVGAISKMTVTDAKNILTGGDDAATRYFRKNTETELTAKFTPIVGKAMKKVKLAETYDRFAGKGAEFGLVDKRDARLEDYITRKAMDGLFLVMAEQEKAIRDHPLQATGELAKKIFAAIRK